MKAVCSATAIRGGTIPGTFSAAQVQSHIQLLVPRPDSGPNSMTTLIPTSSACYTLQLPPPEKDDRLNLNVRTGSASVLCNSFVFTFGGLTIGLDLADAVTVPDITALFLANVANKLRRIRNYLSGELFYLDLISRVWTRVDVPPGAPRPRPRLFHELARGNGCIYVFGGLVVPDDAPDDAVALVPCNDLWEFSLTTRSWRLLHDGAGHETDPSVPAPRFCHKMTLIDNLLFARKKDHFGLMVAGGLDADSRPLYDNVVYDVVEKRYTDAGCPMYFCAASHDPARDKASGLASFSATDDHRNVNVNYLNSIIVNFREEVEYHLHSTETDVETPLSVEEDSIVIYSPTADCPGLTLNPLLSFRVGKKFGRGKILPLHKKRTSTAPPNRVLQKTIPYNLRYPTGGLFGRNLVITGFLPHDFDISIFIYNKPTGKWSRLNIFCNHDYGSHRFWGGFVWTSHHKVVLLGNYVTSRTTSSVRFFSSMITVSLPVTNVLASMEMAGESRAPENKGIESTSLSETDSLSSTEEESSSLLLQISDLDLDDNPPAAVRRFSNMSVKSEGQKGSANPVSFSEYVHYAAPKVNFTKIRSVFPPAAITLGRNAFDRYGDLISDFELISCDGDRIPVCMTVLMERWGKYFIDLLSRAYVQAVDKFEHDQAQGNAEYRLRASKSSGSSLGSRIKLSSYSGSDTSHEQPGEEKFHIHMKAPKPSQKEAPQFRLPFQDSSSSTSVNSRDSSGGSIDPHKQERKNSTSSASSLIKSTFLDIPPQLPLPNEPIPAIPATPVSFRSSSRKNSTDAMSPRASLIHTLTVLRNIPTRSPKDSPFDSPRGSISINHDSTHPEEDVKRKSPKHEIPEFFNEQHSKELDAEKQPLAGGSVSSDVFSNAPEFVNNRDGFHGLLNFQNIDPESFKFEPSLIPRKLYVPFGTSSLKGFAEYLYTGQVGNKWTLRPCTLDCLLMARYFKVPLLYDLICEVLYGIIGRKEVYVVKEGKKYKKKLNALFEKTHASIKSTFRFPLDEYEGFMDTVDDGYLDIALLRKSSNMHKNSTSTLGSKKKSSLSMSRSSMSKSLSESPRHKSKDEPLSPKTGKDHDSSEEDSAGDASNSSEEDQSTMLHFLDFSDKKANVGPRSKSIFDKSAYDYAMQSLYDKEDEETGEDKDKMMMTTLEMLVSPDSPEPSDYIVDLIYEAASMCTDVKLMLRAMNARHMGHALKQTVQEYEDLERAMKNDLENVEEEDPEDDLDITKPARERPSLGHKPPSSHLLTSAARSASVTPTDERTEFVSGSPHKQPEVTRTSTGSFKMTPFKAVRADSLEKNRELDRRIAQMIKKEEKLKQKAAKEEKVKRNTQEKLERKGKHEDISDAASIFSKSTPMDESVLLASGRSRLFRFGNRKHKDGGSSGEILAENTPIERTQSSTSLALQRSSGSKKSTGAKKGLFGLRKR